jgi:hypothetical protein
MKKTLMIAAAALVLATAGGAKADDDIGCGLGTQLWEGEEGLVFKVIGATTNGTFGNQTFGITSGTLGCKQSGVITADARVQMFASANIDALARDMARGEGETLDSFAHLMSIPDQDKGHFFRFTQAHFVDIFAGDEVTAGEMLSSLHSLMAKDATLSAYVRPHPPAGMRADRRFFIAPAVHAAGARDLAAHSRLSLLAGARRNSVFRRPVPGAVCGR